MTMPGGVSCYHLQHISTNVALKPCYAGATANDDRFTSDTHFFMMLMMTQVMLLGVMMTSRHTTAPSYMHYLMTLSDWLLWLATTVSSSPLSDIFS